MDPVTWMAIGTVAAAAGTAYGAIDSHRQAKKAEKRQADYQNKIAAEEAAAAAEEQRIKDETLARQQAYGASLIEGSTSLNNMLSGGYSDNPTDFSLLKTELGVGTTVDDIFA